MLDELGLVAEATVANVFAVHDGALLTPQPRACLDGITRRAVMQLGRDAGLTVLEVGITPEALAEADEIFLTGTSAEVAPVVEYEGRRLGDGAGPVTRQLADAYAALTSAEGTAVPTAA